MMCHVDPLVDPSRARLIISYITVNFLLQWRMPNFVLFLTVFRMISALAA